MDGRWRRCWLVVAFVALVGGCADRPEETWQLAQGGLYSGAIGPDGNWIATGSVFHGGALWHRPDFTRRYDWNLDTDRQFGGYSVFTATVFSDNGQRVATVQGRRLVIWSVAQGSTLAFYETPAAIRSAAFDHAGSRVLLGLDDGTAAVFDVDSGATVQRLDGHQGPVHAAALSADGRHAVTGGDDRRAILWSVDDGLIVQHRSHGNQVRTVALSASGQYALSAAQGEDGMVWSTRSGNTVRTVPTQRRVISAARFAQNDNLLVVGDRRHYVTVWQLQDMQRQDRWRMPGEGLYSRSSNVVLDVRWVSGAAYALSSNGTLALFQ